MSEHFLLPITYSEFLDWYNRRTKQFMSLRMIPAVVDGPSEMVTVEGEWEEVMIDTIPEYDEDFQVVIALVEATSRRKYQEIQVGEDRARAPAVQQLDIMDLRRLYPITDRGERQLKSRLDSRIRLGSPLFSDAIEKQNRRRNRQQADAGGNAIVELFGLETSTAQVDVIRDEALQAIQAKVSGETHRLSHSLTARLVAYDRHGKPSFPSTSIGSIYDYFSVVRQVHENQCSMEIQKEVMGEVLRPAQEALKRLGQRKPAFEAVYDEALASRFQILEEISPLEVDTCPPRAAILFLDLRDQLRRSGGLEETTVDMWVDLMRGNRQEMQLALGLWMVGAFFDFSRFADDYYGRHRPQFMDTSTMDFV